LIKELVMLSTKHGILTPYTAFLSDENAAPRDLAAHERGAMKAGDLLNRLDEASGKAAFAQRATKKELLEAQHTEVGGWAVAAGSDAAQLRDIDADRQVAAGGVRVVDGKALYRRGNVWYAYDAAKASASKPGEKAQVIDRFSEEYFKLVREHPTAAAKILARQKEGEEVRFEAGDKVYHVK
jgi:Ca-activated chloride channel homolog